MKVLSVNFFLTQIFFLITLIKIGVIFLVEEKLRFLKQFAKTNGKWMWGIPNGLFFLPLLPNWSCDLFVKPHLSFQRTSWKRDFFLSKNQINEEHL